MFDKYNNLRSTLLTKCPTKRRHIQPCRRGPLNQHKLGKLHNFRLHNSTSDRPSISSTSSSSVPPAAPVDPGGSGAPAAAPVGGWVVRWHSKKRSRWSNSKMALRACKYIKLCIGQAYSVVAKCSHNVAQDTQYRRQF